MSVNCERGNGPRKMVDDTSTKEPVSTVVRLKAHYKHWVDASDDLYILDVVSQ